MLIWTTRFSRKKAVLTVIAMGIVMAVLILLTGRTEPGNSSTHPSDRRYSTR